MIADSRLLFGRAVLVRGLMSDEDWALFAPFAIEGGPRRGRSPWDHRLVMDGVLWMARTGSAWPDLTITSANGMRSVSSGAGPWLGCTCCWRR